MSGASRLSKKSGATQPKDQLSVKGSQIDAQSIASSRPRTEQYSELDEDDEWTAIQKFNTLLHYEEQKQQMIRDKERKRLIKQELDRQLEEKKFKKT